ncbi:MAG: penicillin-insensitive murein endopeptidase [Pseudomonadota bacterium]
MARATRLIVGLAILFGGWMPVVAVASDQDEPVIAKRQFGMVAGPARLKPRVYGGYARGCVSGAEKLPDESGLWQTMRTWRNRHWGLGVSGRTGWMAQERLWGVYPQEVIN